MPYNAEFIKLLVKPIEIFGAGYIKEVDAPELKKELAQSVAFLAQQAKFVGVRDNNTKKFLISNNVQAKKIAVIGDPAALLAEKKPLLNKLKFLGIDKIKTAPLRVGLNLNYSGWLGFGKWHDDILNAYRAELSILKQSMARKFII